MKSTIVKRSIVVAGHKTSVRLEDAFWDGLKDIGREDNTTLSELVADIDTRRLDGNLSSSIRLFVLTHFRDAPRTAAGRTGTVLHFSPDGRQAAQANAQVTEHARER